MLINHTQGMNFNQTNNLKNYFKRHGHKKSLDRRRMHRLWAV
jgi:hypothetical protein